ncbi:hypothetical protein ABZ864_40475 [Streptomyces sp. NPDC047082]|uniref:hypothetical protein n=1 Tax=Streptomyces sp. NPDC047082 TaxID=3155259 RepID=UPI00340E4BA7
MASLISTRQHNQLASVPATVQACACDRRTQGEQRLAEGAARDQLAFTRIAARSDSTPEAES